jgi:cyclopropane fatty-acyl-phospholipid synthase-like methyltransferase
MAGKLDVSIDDVNQFYSEECIAVFQLVVQKDHFGIGGPTAVEELAKRAGIAERDRVLDVGSGIGGPARFLAGTFGCRVTGLDISEANYNEALKRTKEAGLDSRFSFRFRPRHALKGRDLRCGLGGGCLEPHHR